jgi:hypothetical protein
MGVKFVMSGVCSGSTFLRFARQAKASEDASTGTPTRYNPPTTMGWRLRFIGQMT